MEPNTSAPVSVGDILAHKYRVERVLGVGGMGAVVAATHLDLGELRAVKFMLPHLRTSTQAVERFLREARATVRLKSEHVVKIHDVGRFDTGEPYLVMEYLTGEDLDEVIRSSGVLPVVMAVDYLLQAMEAIAEAHAAGIVHRDIKPANLFLCRDVHGTPLVKVLDFGISKLTLGLSPVDGALTGECAMFGSPFYMPPEQMRSARNADARADIWALGVILYQSLVGRVPFRGDSMPELCVAVLKDVPPLPSSQRPDVPPALDAVIQRCLEKEREARFQSVAELAVALEPFGPPTAPLAVGRICRLQGVPLPPSAEAALQSGEYRALPSSPGAPPGAAPGPDTGALPPGYPVPGLLPRRGETSPVLPDAATQLWPGHAAPAAARPAAPGQIPEPFGSQPGLAPVPLPSQPGLGVRVGTAPPWGNTKPPTEPRSRWAVVAVSSATALVLLAGGATVLLRGQQGGKPAAAPVAGTTEPAAATTDMPAGAETARLAAGSGGSASGKQDDRGSASDQPDAGMAGPAAEGSSTPMRPPSVPAHPGPRRSSQPSPPPVPTPTGPGDDNNPFSGRH